MQKESEWALPSVSRVWDTRDVRSTESFQYFREGVCQSFMDLVSEPDQQDNWHFVGRVESIPMGTGAVNKVDATAHLVSRTPSQIARSPSECFYLNYKIRGECRINQSDSEIVLDPGDVGIFDSTIPFTLEHRRKAALGVASFWVPREELSKRLPTGGITHPRLLSNDPNLGQLIREAARTLSETAGWLSPDASAKMFDMLLDLTALALSPASSERVDGQRSRSDALLLAIRNYVDRNLRRPDLNVERTATAHGISKRYLHKLFARSGQSFNSYVLEQRLLGVANALTSPINATLPITTLAFDWGFTDPSHFSRAFKRRFGTTPGDWRKAGFENS